VHPQFSLEGESCQELLFTYKVVFCLTNDTSIDLFIQLIAVGHVTRVHSSSIYSHISLVDVRIGCSVLVSE